MTKSYFKRNASKASSAQGEIFSKQNPEDKALDIFAETMIQHIEKCSANDWQKPWIANNAFCTPRNIDGRYYNNGNELMLAMMMEIKGYKMPFFVTHQRLNEFNDTAKAKKENLPLVHVLKGEKAFPVIFPAIVHLDLDGNKLDRDQVATMEEDEYKKIFSTKVYQVFNIEQTNLKDARPSIWEELTKQCGLNEEKPVKAIDEVFKPLDAMIVNNAWYCPIKEKYGNDAYFAPSSDFIVLPERGQFKDAEHFVGTAFHEMAHSTGHENRLNRLEKSGRFGSKSYAREELVAELTSALVCARFGYSKYIETDSASYAKSWLTCLKEDAKFIKTLLNDIKKASAMILKRVEEIQDRLDKGLSIEPIKNEQSKAA